MNVNIPDWVFVISDSGKGARNHFSNGLTEAEVIILSGQVAGRGRAFGNKFVQLTYKLDYKSAN